MQDEDGDTLLIQACRCGDIEVARVLLDHGANPDYQNKVWKPSLVLPSSVGPLVDLHPGPLSRATRTIIIIIIHHSPYLLLII